MAKTNTQKDDAQSAVDLLSKPTAEVIEAIEAGLEEDVRAQLLAAEMASDNPREPVVHALGGGIPADPAETPAVMPNAVGATIVNTDPPAEAPAPVGPDMLDPSRPSEMVHHDGIKMHLQDNKIYHPVDKKLVARADGK